MASAKAAPACAICLLEYDDTEHYPVRTVPCVHILCRSCATEWHKRTSKCGLCTGQVVCYQPAKEAARVFGLTVAPDVVEKVEEADNPLFDTVTTNNEDVVMVRRTLEEEQQEEEEARQDSLAHAYEDQEPGLAQRAPTRRELELQRMLSETARRYGAARASAMQSEYEEELEELEDTDAEEEFGLNVRAMVEASLLNEWMEADYDPRARSPEPVLLVEDNDNSRVRRRERAERHDQRRRHRVAAASASQQPQPAAPQRASSRLGKRRCQ